MPHRRVARAVLAVLVLAVLAGCGGGDDSPTVETGDQGQAPTTTAAAGPTTSGPATGTVLSVTYRNGTVEGASRQRAPLGQPVIVRVTSDVAEEVHVHGYDKFGRVPAGGTVDIRFDADIPGVFEVELEGSHKLLFTMEVR